MAIAPGTRLGTFEVAELLGAGAMGEVYRARDTKLGRDVAIKVLPEAFAGDATRLARFEREAKILASVSHGNIAALHDLQEADGVRFLVMELAEGDSLDRRLARGPIPLDETLRIFAQIAEALESAHDQGVLHRDLKPANIVVTPGGKVKVLDFGLAKAFDATGSHTGETKTAPWEAVVTGEGRIVGTPAYMSPEQTRGGGQVDKRADIWSFGCCLYEALSGKRPFVGETATDLFADIIKGEPDWEALPASTPARIRVLLWRCLQKDPQRRLRDIGEARFEITESSSDPSGTFMIPGATVSEPAPSRTRIVGVGVIGLIAGAVLAALALLSLLPKEAPVAPVTRFTLEVPGLEDNPGREVAVSPDGTLLAYLKDKRLVLRRLDRLEAREFPGTDGAVMPVFSPDSRWVAYYSFGNQVLEKVSVDGGQPITLCEVPTFAGGSWSEDGTIIFGSLNPRGLQRVSAQGGTPELILPVPEELAERVYYAGPTFLPGGKVAAFVEVNMESLEDPTLKLVDLETMDVEVVGPGRTPVAVSPDGYLIYGHDGNLMAQRLDRDGHRTAGDPWRVLEGVRWHRLAAIDFAVSRSGLLAYIPGDSQRRRDGRLVWIDSSGNVEPAVDEILQYPRYPRLSPDGRRVVLTHGPSLAGNLWVYDLVGGAPPLNLTFEGHNTLAVWSPDGKRLAFHRAPPSTLCLVAADGSSAEPDSLLSMRRGLSPMCWSADGKLIFILDRDPETGEDIYEIPVDEGGEPHPLLRTRFDEEAAVLSPDGRWLAYVSDRSGQAEVWVMKYPDGPPVPVSSQGGREPVWARDGTELYFMSGSKMMAAKVVATDPELRFARPVDCFEGGFVPHDPSTPRLYDVHPDGRFLMIEPVGEEAVGEIVVVQNWWEELRTLAAARAHGE